MGAAVGLGAAPSSIGVSAIATVVGSRSICTVPRRMVSCRSGAVVSWFLPGSGAPFDNASGLPSPLVSIARSGLPSMPTSVSGMPSPLVSVPVIGLPSASTNVSGMPSPLVSVPVTGRPCASLNASGMPSPSLSTPTILAASLVPSSRFESHNAVPPIAASHKATTATAATTIRRRWANNGRWTYAAVTEVVEARPRAVIKMLCCVGSPETCRGPLIRPFVTAR